MKYFRCSVGKKLGRVFITAIHGADGTFWEKTFLRKVFFFRSCLGLERILLPVEKFLVGLTKLHFRSSCEHFEYHGFFEKNQKTFFSFCILSEIFRPFNESFYEGLLNLYATSP